MVQINNYSLTLGAKDAARNLVEGWKSGAIPQQFSFFEIRGGDRVVATKAFEGDFNCPPRSILTELAEAKLIHMMQVSRETWEVTLLNSLNEAVREETEERGAVGVYFTPPDLISMLVDLVKPRSGEFIYDPACGVGSILLEAKAYIERNQQLSPAQRQRLYMHGVYGREINTQIYQHAQENFGREGLNQANLWHGDTLLKQSYIQGFPQQFDVVVSNAPFSERATAEEQKNFPVQTRFLELLFLQHAIESLKTGGRCAIVMPDGVISRTDPEFREVKTRLLNECDLHRIVQLADSVAPYARIKSSILLFTKGRHTEKTLYFRPDEKPVELTYEAIEARFYDLTPPDDAPVVESFQEDRTSGTDTNKYRIFISYRRDDSAWPTGRLYDYLTRLDDPIFIDRAAISPGELFTQAIETAIDSCDVLLAMIGSKWLDITDKQGERRLAQDNDLVRREVASALAKGKLVIPVLIDGTLMPSTRELPNDLKELAFRNVVTLTTKYFEHEAELIAQSITQRLYTTDHG
jgi:tRNA1(Val) A37 N6-methylase TrmN6